MFKRKSNAPRRLIALAGAAVLVTLCAHTVQAQRFQYVYSKSGGPSSNGTGGYNGVQQCSTGGYIAVGSTIDSGTGGNSASEDMFILRTDSHGNKVWENRLNSYTTKFNPSFNFQDSATCVRECANGDFIVAGYSLVTHPPSAPGAGIGSRDVFLIRLNSGGGVIWARHYGDEILDERAFDIIETTTGPTKGPAVKGDFVVAGYQQHPGAGSPARGILYRVRSNGNPVWQNTYSLDTTEDHRLFALDECINGIADTVAGDIVAAGQTDGYGATTDGWIIRVSPTNGGFSGANHGVLAVDGGAFDGFRAVDELTVGARAGHIVAAGSTTSRPLPSTSSEVLVVETQARPSLGLVANRVFGDDSSEVDEGFGIKQIKVAALNAGNIVVTGQATLPGGFGNGDGFLQEMTTGNLTLSGQIAIYGDTARELLYSVSDVVAMGTTTPATTAGFILCGSTKNKPALWPQSSLWLVKTDAGKSSYCNYDALDVSQEVLTLATDTTPPAVTTTLVSWSVEQQVFDEPWEDERCYTSNSVRGSGSQEENDGISSVSLDNALSLAAEAVPNPIRMGAPFSLAFKAGASGTAQVVVSDVQGRVVKRMASEHGTGDANLMVDTRGWATGTYIVRIEADGRVMTTRVVVLDR